MKALTDSWFVHVSVPQRAVESRKSNKQFIDLVCL